jgi:hypothetical protein
MHAVFIAARFADDDHRACAVAAEVVDDRGPGGGPCANDCHGGRLGQIAHVADGRVAVEDVVLRIDCPDGPGETAFGQARPDHRTNTAGTVRRADNGDGFRAEQCIEIADGHGRSSST